MLAVSRWIRPCFRTQLLIVANLPLIINKVKKQISCNRLRTSIRVRCSVLPRGQLNTLIFQHKTSEINNLVKTSTWMNSSLKQINLLNHHNLQTISSIWSIWNPSWPRHSLFSNSLQARARVTKGFHLQMTWISISILAKWWRLCSEILTLTISTLETNPCLSTFLFNSSKKYDTLLKILFKPDL